MSYQVLSRKYRPQRFGELVGQEHVARILQNALAQDRVGHAYLLVGPRGVGKTTVARIVARALNCETLAGAMPDDVAAIEPCGTCASCTDIAAGSDLDVVEMDAASNNAVDDVRALREQVGYATIRSRYRIWIVDEVHMLSLPAFNAFLKTLEEPPPQVKFLFCTTEEHKLPDTFRSRCQRVEFRPIDEAGMAGRLEDLAKREGVTLEDGLSSAISHAALGGLRDAESQLEQLIAARTGDGPIRIADLDALSGRASVDLLERLCAAVDSGDAAASLDAVDACLAAGAKPGVLLDQWLEALRARLVGMVRDADGGWARLARAVDVLLKKRMDLRAGAEGGLVLQVAAVTLARLPDARDLDALIGALRGEAGDGEAGESEPEPAREAGGAAAPPPAGQADTPRTRPARRAERDEEESKLDKAGLQARWNAILTAAAARSPALAGALQHAHIASLHDNVLELAFRDDAGPARATLMRKEIQLACTQVMRECTGVTLRPVPIALRDEPEAQARVFEDMRVHPAVQLVTDATGGRLLNVERASGTAAPSRQTTDGEEGPDGA